MAIPLTSGLLVSCQAQPESPMHGPDTMSRFARSAVLGGARGIRAQGDDDVSTVKATVAVPVIGLINRPGHSVYITPSVADAVAVAEAGADVVAVDATLRPRRDGSSTAQFLHALRAAVAVPILADIDSVEAAVAAEAAGASYVATTLVGYTSGPAPLAPDNDLLAASLARVSIPVIAEGRYHTVEQVALAFQLGAFAMVVGEAITDPIALTRRFAAAAAVARGSHV